MSLPLYNSILCRLCCEENASGIILYDNDSNSDVDICSMINTYLPIKVEDDGILPRTICPGCNLQLHSTVQFFDLLIEGQKKIRELWKEQVNREKRREKQQQQQSLLISKNRSPLLQTSVAGIQLASNQSAALTIQDSCSAVSGGAFDLFDPSSLFQTTDHDVTQPPVDQHTLQQLDGLQLDQVLVEGEAIYDAEHGLVLRVAGLERPRKKRGRPRKQLTATPAESAETIADEQPLPTADEEQLIEDGDGRRRRRRKIPLRFREAVQGKELERILKEEGVTDGEDEREMVPEGEEGERREGEGNEGEGDNAEDATSRNLLPGIADDKEVIGHLETSDGQVGELIIVNKKAAVAASASSRLARLHHNQKRRLRRRKKPRFYCDICGRTFMHIGKYRYHKSFHTGIKFECVECKKRFTAKENFELHQKMTGHTGEGIVKENEEGESKENEEGGGGGGAEGGKVACEKCQKTFSTKQNLEIHRKAVHCGEKPYKCEVCDKRFGYQNSLRCHVLTHHEQSPDDKVSQGGGFPCDICGRRLNHPSSVIYHKETEHSDGRRFVCDRCGKAFKHKQLLHRHQLVHTNHRPHQCQTCSASFKTKANLLSHQATHTGEKRHFCEICGTQFAYKTSLILHYRWHSGQKPYECEVCKKAFSQKGNLHEHMRIHTGEKPYACMYCEKRFTTSSQFKLHVKRHTGERPWACDVCGKTFLHKDTWKCHQRRHNNDRPFACVLCRRTFSEQWALKKHMRLHTGERPYQCQHCGKLFADCSNLAKHRKVHERDNERFAANAVALGEAEEGEAEGGSGGGAVAADEVEEGGAVEAAGAAMWSAAPEQVQQIIYVTYQDPTDPTGKVCEKYLLPGVLGAGDGGGGDGGGEEDPSKGPTLQFTDEHGNPVQITLTDDNQLQMAVGDDVGDSEGSLQLQTSAVLEAAGAGAGANTNYVIKVTPESAAALMNGDGNKLATAIEGDIPASYAFMIQNTAQKDNLVETFCANSVQIPAEYLNIN